MAQYREENPEATEYALTTELEAQEFLKMLVGQISAAAGREPDKRRRKEYKRVEAAMRRAWFETRALHYIATLNAEDQLEVYGLKLTVPAVMVMQ